MKYRRIQIDDFLFTEIGDDLIIVFHPFWNWCERFENGKRIIRLKAK